MSEVFSSNIGDRTKIWQFSVILEGAQIGSDCNICSHVFVENKVTIGDNVTIKAGVQIWDGVSIEDNVFVGPNVSFSNDKRPRSKHFLDQSENTTLKHGCSIGSNATILPGITVGEFAIVGAGAVVTKDVCPYSIVVGNPARITSFITNEVDADYSVPRQQTPRFKPQDPYLISIDTLHESRGSLTFFEAGNSLPFTLSRTFFVYDVPSHCWRGGHAHKDTWQLLISISGSCSVFTDSLHSRKVFHLDSPSQGLIIPPFVWATQFKHSPGHILCVTASDLYDPSDYVRDYNDFKQLLHLK